MATAAPAKIQAPQTEEELAARYAGDLVYKAMIETGEPLKASEVSKAVGHPGVSLQLARVVLATNPNITAVDRKWTIWTRFLDVQNTTDRNIRRVLNTFRQPIRRRRSGPRTQQHLQPSQRSLSRTCWIGCCRTNRATL